MDARLLLSLAQPHRRRHDALALTNNLRQPGTAADHGTFVGCVKGIGAAARTGIPAISGGVTLYNETNGEAILPTPVIGGVGLIEKLIPSASAFPPNHSIVLIGETDG